MWKWEWEAFLLHSEYTIEESMWHSHADSKVFINFFRHLVHFVIEFQTSARQSVSVGFLIQTNLNPCNSKAITYGNPLDKITVNRLHSFTNPCYGSIVTEITDRESNWQEKPPKIHYVKQTIKWQPYLNDFSLIGASQYATGAVARKTVFWKKYCKEPKAYEVNDWVRVLSEIIPAGGTA